MLEHFVSKQNIARYRRLADAATSDRERIKLILLLRKEREQFKGCRSSKLKAAIQGKRTAN